MSYFCFFEEPWTMWMISVFIYFGGIRQMYKKDTSMGQGYNSMAKVLAE